MPLIIHKETEPGISRAFRGRRSREWGGEEMQEHRGKGLKGKMEHYGLFDAVLPRLSQHHLSTLVQQKDGRGLGLGGFEGSSNPNHSGLL